MPPKLLIWLNQPIQNKTGTKVATLWVQAVAWMQAVPPGSPRRAFAEKKVVEYMRNLVYSQQQAGATRSQASTVSFSSDLLNEQLELYLSYVAAVGRQMF